MVSLSFDSSSLYHIIHQGSGLALEVPDVDANSKFTVQTGPANENNHKQLWIFRQMGGGNFQIISAVPNRPLSADGDNLNLGHGGGSSNQVWFIDTTVYNKIRVSLSKFKSKFLGIQHNKVIIRNNVPFQLADSWEFKRVENNHQVNQTCFITDHEQQKIIDTPVGKNSQGVSVSLSNPDYRLNQRFRIYRAGQVYVIKGLITGLNLDIRGESEDEGTPIIQWHSTGGTNQFWKFEEKGDKVFRISSWMNPQLQIGYKGHHVVTSRDHKFLWKIHGYIP